MSRYHKSQELQALAEFALSALRFHFNTMNGADLSAINRAVFNQTECGAWVKLNERAEIVFGSIVEGSDAEFTCDPINVENRDEKAISVDIGSALEWLEHETSAAWLKANK